LAIKRPDLNSEKLCILLDTESLGKVEETELNSLQKLLKYKNTNNLEMIRAPGETEIPELLIVPSYVEEVDSKNDFSTIKINRKDSIRGTVFGFIEEDIRRLGNEFFKKESMNSFEYTSIRQLFIWSALFNHQENCKIFITHNSKLLRKRNWLESRISVSALGIVTIDEAIEIMGLFLRRHGKYHIHSNYHVNNGLWYWLSFRSKIKHFIVGEKYLDSFSRRFVFLLTCLDEIGYQYYSNVNNDTAENTLYHFNYLITLITGIFDSLALQTNTHYEMGFSPQMISLSSKAAQDFLRAIERKDPLLRRHINEYVDLINLIYGFREVIVHREMFDWVRYESRVEDNKFNTNYVVIDENRRKLISKCKDKKLKYDPFKMYGLFIDGGNYYLEPYQFAKTVCSKLIAFSDRYLELLGFTNFLLESKKSGIHEQFTGDIEAFETSSLEYKLF